MILKVRERHLFYGAIIYIKEVQSLRCLKKYVKINSEKYNNYLKALWKIHKAWHKKVSENCNSHYVKLGKHPPKEDFFQTKMKTYL